MTNKPLIILDLDETLINSEKIRGFDKNKYKEKMKLFNWKEMSGDFYVFERPHLQTFLNFVFENFEVSVWTAASKNYAIWILANMLKIGSKRKLKHIFFDYHCKQSEKIGRGKKDLSILSKKIGLTDYDMSRVIIIDDNEEVYKTQPKNCISVKEFLFSKNDSENDGELLGVIEMLKNIQTE